MLPLSLGAILAALQFAAAVVANRLKPAQGRRLSWALIAVALALMGARRPIPIVRYFSEGAYRIGIMMTELVTNAMKYAFQGRGGALLIGAEKRGERALFTLHDDGPGLPEGAHDSGGFGLELPSGLAEELVAERGYPLPALGPRPPCRRHPRWAKLASWDTANTTSACP